MFKKFLSVLFLVFMVVGFSMGPVNATVYNYNISGKVDDHFKFDRYYSTLNFKFCDVNDAALAFDKSNLFNKIVYSNPVIGTNDFYNVYTFYASHPGVISIVSHWFWTDTINYNFNIIA
jgi:hypothetical protein